MPPLDYGRVYRLKAAHPELEIVINGGIGSLEEAEAHLAHVDGVALGRAAYQNPYLLAEVDRPPVRRRRRRAPTRRAVLEQLVPYVERHLRGGGRLNNMARHILGLYHGRPRARAFRRHLSEQAPREGAGIEVLLRGHAHRRRRAQRRPWRLRNKLAAQQLCASRRRHASSDGCSMR